jgi:hypothetical protein
VESWMVPDALRGEWSFAMTSAYLDLAKLRPSLGS